MDLLIRHLANLHLAKVGQIGDNDTITTLDGRVVLHRCLKVTPNSLAIGVDLDAEDVVASPTANDVLCDNPALRILAMVLKVK